jgi:hypothetical protein
MLQFLSSHHCATYVKLAFKYFRTPDHVYAIAHGKEAHSNTDRRIAHELLRAGIVHRYRHSHNPSDYVMQ